MLLQPGESARFEAVGSNLELLHMITPKPPAGVEEGLLGGPGYFFNRATLRRLSDACGGRIRRFCAESSVELLVALYAVLGDVQFRRFLDDAQGRGVLCFGARARQHGFSTRPRWPQGAATLTRAGRLGWSSQYITHKSAFVPGGRRINKGYTGNRQLYKKIDRAA